MVLNTTRVIKQFYVKFAQLFKQ